MGLHYGIDVSSNNAHPINLQAAFTYLQQLGGGDQPFLIVKINEGTGYINPYANGDVATGRALGFAVAGYLMDHGSADPGQEESVYRSVAGNLPQTDDIELPDGLSVAQYIQHVAGLVAQDPNALVYLNQSEVSEGFPEGDGLWLAEYNGSPAITTYPCVIHQYDSQGTIPGCAGIFDMNVWTGSEAQYNAFFGITPPAPTPPPTPLELDMISPVISYRPGQEDTFQVRGGALIHYWANTKGHGSEIVIGPVAPTATTLTATVPDQVPQVSVLGGNCNVTVELSSGHPFTAAQGQTNTTPLWGARDWTI